MAQKYAKKAPKKNRAQAERYDAKKKTAVLFLNGRGAKSVGVVEK